MPYSSLPPTPHPPPICSIKMVWHCIFKLEHAAATKDSVVSAKLKPILGSVQLARNKAAPPTSFKKWQFLPRMYSQTRPAPKAYPSNSYSIQITLHKAQRKKQLKYLLFVLFPCLKIRNCEEYNHQQTARMLHHLAIFSILEDFMNYMFADLCRSKVGWNTSSIKNVILFWNKNIPVHAHTHLIVPTTQMQKS